MTAAPDLETWRRDLADAITTNDAGHPAQAERAFRRLITALDRAEVRGRDVVVLCARAHLGLATSTFDRRGRLATALEEVAAAESLARAADAPQLLAAVLGQRGLIHLRAGDTGAALIALDAAAGYLDQAEPFDRMTILLNRGALHLEAGELAAARRDLARCAHIAADAGHRVREFMARHNLGYAEFLAGNLPRALAEMAAAARLDSGGPWPTALLDQARVLREAGLTTEAETTLLDAEDLYRRESLWQGVAETLLTRAECALTRSPADAADAARQAERIFRRRANVRWQRKAEHVELLAELAATRHGATARRLRRLAARAAAFAATCADEQRRDLARSARLIAADARLLAGDAPEWDAPPTIARQDGLAIRLLTREVRARAAQRDGDTVRACTQIRRGLAEVRAYQARFGSLDMRTAAAVHGIALAEMDLAIALGTRRPTAVLGSIERTRAASSRLPPVVPPEDEDTARLLADLRLVEEEARAKEGSAEPAEQARLRSRAAELRGAVRTRGWHREGVGARTAARATARLSTIRGALADDEALVSLATHDGVWHAVVIDRRGARHERLAAVGPGEELVRRVRSDLDALALPMLAPGMRSAVQASLASGLAGLDAALLGPLDLAGRPLVISPAGLLALLPWGMLPSRAGAPTVVAPSATAWSTAATTPSRGPGTRVTALAGPGLVRSHDEAHAVAASWAGAALVNDGATTHALIAALAGSDIVHIAAHGRHDPDNPLFSSLRLADGPLFAHELDGATTVASCVVLSACEVGMWAMRPGDEPLGLTSVLLQMGVRSVVAGVARVDDAVAADVMAALHRRMAEGVDSATALAHAMDDLPPDVVAPFVCFGAAWSAPGAATVA